jgi:hypothetical protein
VARPVLVQQHARQRPAWTLLAVRRTLRRLPHQIRELIVRAMGKPFEFEIESIMPWTRREFSLGFSRHPFGLWFG